MSDDITNYVGELESAGVTEEGVHWQIRKVTGDRNSWEYFLFGKYDHDHDNPTADINDMRPPNHPIFWQEGWVSLTVAPEPDVLKQFPEDLRKHRVKDVWNEYLE